MRDRVVSHRTLSLLTDILHMTIGEQRWPAHRGPLEGLETLQFATWNVNDSDSAVSNSGNICTRRADLAAAVVGAWSDLPPALRASVAAIIRAASTGGTQP